VANDEQDIAKLDTSIPQTARIWNYLLGGKDNFEADRQVGEETLKGQPALAENAMGRRGRPHLETCPLFPSTTGAAKPASHSSSGVWSSSSPARSR
jgi:hypothetical protein